MLNRVVGIFLITLCLAVFGCADSDVASPVAASGVSDAETEADGEVSVEAVEIDQAGGKDEIAGGETAGAIEAPG